MTRAHRPEPWACEPATTGRHGDSKLVDAEGYTLARVYDYDGVDARRIVACVNACKDWSTEALEAWAAGDQNPLSAELAALMAARRGTDMQRDGT